MDKTGTPVVDVVPTVRARSAEVAGIVRSGLDRGLVLSTAIATVLVVALAAVAWTLWNARGVTGPLLPLAALMLLAAAVAGVYAAARPAEGKSLPASLHNLLFEFGLLFTLVWVVDVVIKALKQ